VNVSLSSASGQTVTVHYQTSDGTATAGSDYTSSSGDVTFAPGTTLSTFSVAISNDSLDEPSETLGLTLSSPNLATLGSQVTGTLSILDDDPPPTVQFSAGSLNFNEN